MKQHHDNDNDELPFVTIAAATANALSFLNLHKKENEQPRSDTDPRQADEEKRRQELEYVERRLADIRAFERRFTDGSRRKRKY